MNRPGGILAAAACLVALTASSCSADEPTPESPRQTTITVMAASSLTETFTAIARRYEDEHPGTTIQLVFGASSTLATQVRMGAPADVFASAAKAPMDKLVEKESVTGAKTFARNTIAVAVPAKNPAAITSVQDLARAKVALCQEEVPCGVAAARFLDSAKVTLTPVTRESDVKSVLTKVSMGEVDAGLVYATDITAAGKKVKRVAAPSGVEATTEYPIAVVKASKNSDVASDFIAAVLSPEGQQTLEQAGFLPAES